MPTPFIIADVETSLYEPPAGPPAGPPAPEALRRLLEYAGSPLPPEYEAAIRQHDGFECAVGEEDDEAFVVFFSCEEVVTRNEIHGLKERGSPLLAVGGDGAGEAFAIDLTNGEWAIVNWVDIGSGEFELRFPSLRSLLGALANGTAFEGPST